MFPPVWPKSQPHRTSLRLLLILGLLLPHLGALPALARPLGTDVPAVITSNVTWNENNNPYKVKTTTTIAAGATLTIQAGVQIESDGGVSSYQFNVLGKLVAQGTPDKPILFKNPDAGWIGLSISGTPDKINTGSSLKWVVVDGGGFQGSGVGGGLNVSNAEVTVRNCTFMNSNGDGILAGNQGNGTVHIYDSAFINNAGYAVYFEDGSVNPTLQNLTALGNGGDLPFGGNLVAMNNSTLHGDHTWENMGLDYLLLGHTVVAADGVLTIQPGNDILVPPGNDGLDVRGRIIAAGSQTQPIHLLAANPEQGWSGLHVQGSPEQQATAILNHVNILSGGHFGSGNLHLEYASATINDSRFEFSEDAGAYLDSASHAIINSTQFSNNRTYPMVFLDPDADVVLNQITATGNITNSIAIWGSNPITNAHTWRDAGIPTYDVLTPLEVAPSGSLKIEEGITVRFEYGTSMTVHGVLTTTGTSSEPVVFTNFRGASHPWGSLQVSGTSQQPAQADLKYTTLEYGGYGGYAMLDIKNAGVSLSHCTLRNTASTAIEYRVSSPVYGLASALAPALEVHWSRLYDIGGYAIHNRASTPVDATFNWWGAASGPASADNPGGEGSELSGPVRYLPYLTGATGSFLFLPLMQK